MSNSLFQGSHFSYVTETTPGTTPASPTMKKMRTTNPLQGAPNKALLESQEVLSHRQRENVRHGMRGFQGSVPTELSFAAFNDWLAALLSGTWNGGVLKVGTTVKTFTVEQRIAADKFLIGKGVSPSQLSLSMTPTGLVTGNWDLVGMDFDESATTLGEPTDVATHEPFDGLANAAITEGASSLGTATSIDLTINAQKTVGGLLASNAGDVPTDGQLQITGTMTARFNSLALFQKFEAETDSKLEVVFTNPGGNQTLGILLPRVKYLSGQPQNNDNVIDIALNFEALYDETEASSIVITEITPT